MLVERAAAIQPQHASSARRLRRPRATIIAIAILLFGLALRLATLVAPHAYFPDEIFQYLEAAHRLAFGPGVVPWEYREHVRSWLVPLALAGPMRLGGAIAPDSGLYLLLPRLALLAVSMTTIIAAGAIGRRLSALHALFAMLIAATSVEFVYFSTVALTEPLAAFIFLAAAALLYRNARPKHGALIGAGALLALSCLVRFQYGPAAVVLAVAVSVRRPTQVGWLFVGALPLLCLSALVDVRMGEWPFGWLAANIHQNITLGRSHAWVDGPSYYPQALAGVWGIWLGPLVVLAMLGARRFPGLMLAALTNVLIHSAIAHKEYRYILLTTMLLALLAAIGTADAIRWARRRSSAGRWTHLPLIAASGWLAASASVAAGGPMRHWWTQQQTELSAFAALRDAPKLCGVAIFGFDWTGSGGYAYLHRPVPLFAYALTEQKYLARDTPQFDTIVAPAGVAIPDGFAAEHCFAAAGRTTMCILTRPGKCTPSTSPAEINRQLIRLDR